MQQMQLRFARLIAQVQCLAVLPIGLVLGLGAPAWADVIYTYTGNPFTSAQAPYTTLDKITATMTLTNPLAPSLSLSDVTPNLVALSMSDGVQTLGLAGSTDTTAEFSTDSTGAITNWQVVLAILASPGTTRLLATENTSLQEKDVVDNPVIGSIFLQAGSNENSPGVWTLVPEPFSVTLLAMGLVAMAGVRRRHVCGGNS